MKQVVTATLEAQKKGGCVAVKFEIAYLRTLDFENPSLQSAREAYAKNINGGEPSHEKYKLLQDFLFRYIASEAVIGAWQFIFILSGSRKLFQGTRLRSSPARVCIQ
jgi:hypothetical protein